jgi:hypothetical protein
MLFLILDMGRHLHWIFSRFALAMLSAENHSVFALSPKPSSLKTSIYAHEFKFFIKTTSVFENFELASLLAPGRNIRPLWAGISGGPDYPPLPGRIIRP